MNTMSRIMRFVVGVSCAALFVNGCARGKPDADDERKPAPKPDTRPTRTANGEPIVRLEPAAQQRIGIEVSTLAVQTTQPEIVAFGRLEEDPARTFVLRAPVAGTLHFAPGRDWPRVGESFGDNAVVAQLQPRLAPTDRIGLTSQLATARADLNASTSSVDAARAAYERARVLNADNKNISDRALQDAATHLAAEEARLKSATETVGLLDNALRAAGPTENQRLTLERGGEVVEILAHAGEAIEPGAPILRVAKLDRLLARVDVPVGQRISPEVSTARLFAVGYEDSPIVADWIAVAATAQPTAQGQSFLFRLRSSVFGLRPGVAVTARIPVLGSEQHGVVIPAAALVRVSGKTYAFVQTATNEFVRKEVQVAQPLNSGFFVTNGVGAGERVVTQGAQLLLSEEFKSALAAQTDQG